MMDFAPEDVLAGKITFFSQSLLHCQSPPGCDHDRSKKIGDYLGKTNLHQRDLTFWQQEASSRVSKEGKVFCLN